METIALLLPTRQRPEMLKRLYNSAFSLASRPANLKMVVYIDDDDDSYGDLNYYNLEVVRGKRIVLSQSWNKCYEKVKNEATIFQHLGDDIIFRTEGWDDIVRNTFNEYPDRIVFLWGNDGNSESDKNQFGTHGFLHKNWVDVVGRFLPPYYVSDYNDTHLNEIAKELGRHRFIDITTEHMHFSLGKSSKDQNTEDRLARHEKEKPQDIYNSREKRIERQNEIEKLRQFIENYA